MVRRQQASDRALRPAMRSPGRPYPPRHVEQEFWRRIAEGMGSEDAAVDVGVSAPVRSRWFRNGGGMPPITLAAPSGRYLSFVEFRPFFIVPSDSLLERADPAAHGWRQVDPVTQ